jgi:hypothetical protein
MNEEECGREGVNLGLSHQGMNMNRVCSKRGARVCMSIRRTSQDTAGEDTNGEFDTRTRQ